MFSPYMSHVSHKSYPTAGPGVSLEDEDDDEYENDEGWRPSISSTMLLTQPQEDGGTLRHARSSSPEEGLGAF
jgi:hypothetical protein